MDPITILKKPFIIPSLIAGLIVMFRIAMLFVQYISRRIQRRRKHEALKQARAAARRPDVDSLPPNTI